MKFFDTPETFPQPVNTYYRISLRLNDGFWQAVVMRGDETLYLPQKFYDRNHAVIAARTWCDEDEQRTLTEVEPLKQGESHVRASEKTA